MPVPYPKDEPVLTAPTAGLRKSHGRPPLSTLLPKKIQPPQRSHHRTRSVWLAREVKRVTAYGSARRSEVRAVRQAGLLDADGLLPGCLLLGSWRHEYAALREGVHGGTEWRERAEFDPLSLPRRGQLTFVGRRIDRGLRPRRRASDIVGEDQVDSNLQCAPDASLICDSPKWR